MQALYAPTVGSWFQMLESGQMFAVVAVDGNAETIEVQYFDGDLDEFSRDEWIRLRLEPIEEPEDFSGSLDIADADDLGGTNVTDTAAADWRGLSREQPMYDLSGAEVAARDVAAEDNGEGAANEDVVKGGFTKE